MTSALPEFGRYLVNGLVATAVHYGVLTFNLNVLDFRSAGAANGVAAVAGIATSFAGSRYFVFRRASDSVTRQAARFVALYGAIALLHAAILWLWTDRWRLDYRLGFLIGSCMQVLTSYAANKWVVFR